MVATTLVRAGIACLLGTGCGAATEDTAPAPTPPPAPQAKAATPSKRASGSASEPIAKTDAHGGLAQLVEKEVNDRRTSAVDWATYQGNVQRTGLSPDAPPIDVPRVRWKAKVGIQGYLDAPLVLGKLVVVPSSGKVHNAPDPDDGLHALEAATGKEVWHVVSLGDANGATAADGKVVFGSDDHHVRAVDLATGKELWALRRASTVYSTPLVLEGTAVLGDASGMVFGVAMDTGKLRWEASFSGAIRGGLASDGKSVFVVSQGGHVAALDSNGKERWRVALQRPGWDGAGTEAIEGYGAPLVDGDRLIVPFARDTYYETGPALMAVSTTDGHELWRATTGAIRESWGNLRSSPAVQDGTVVWAEPYSGDVAGLDAATGVPRFRTTVGACLFPQYASPAIAGTLAYVPRHDGHLNAVDLPAGTLRWKLWLGDAASAGTTPPAIEGMSGCEWELPSGSPLYSPPAIGSDGTVYVGSGEGWLYAIEDATRG